MESFCVFPKRSPLRTRWMGFYKTLISARVEKSFWEGRPIFPLVLVLYLFFLFILRPTGYEDIIDILLSSPRVDRLDLEKIIVVF